MRDDNIVSTKALEVIGKILKHQPMVSVFRECERVCKNGGDTKETFGEIAEIVRRYK